MKSEEAGHECIIWVQKFHLPEPKIHQPRTSGWVLMTANDSPGSRYLLK